MKNGKLLILASYAPSLVNFRGPLIQTLVQRGWEVVACAPEQDAAVVQKLADWGVRFRQVPIERTGMNIRKDLACLRTLTQVFREERPDKLFAYTIKPAIYGTLAAAKAGVRGRYVMITGLGSTFETGGIAKAVLSRLVAFLYRRAMRKANRIIIQNPDDRADLLRFGIGTESQFGMVNGSGVDCEQFRQVPVPTGPIRFLCISRLIGDKGVREYAGAAKIVKAEFPEVCFDLVGPLDGNPSAISEAEVTEWNASGFLTWHGPSNDVRPFIEACSVYVLPSYREGTPRTVLEALAMGRAVITTDAPGCRETIVNDEQGFLVPVRDVAALAAAMHNFIEHPHLVGEFAARARLRATEKYDVVKVNAQIIELIDA